MGRIERRRERRRRKRQRAKQRKKERAKQNRVDYFKHIQSKNWKKFRDDILSKPDARCSICQTRHWHQLHHKHYRTLGRETSEDVTIVCSGCHANLHEGKVVGVVDPITRRYLDLHL